MLQQDSIVCIRKYRINKRKLIEKLYDFVMNENNCIETFQGIPQAPKIQSQRESNTHNSGLLNSHKLKHTKSLSKEIKGNIH